MRGFGVRWVFQRAPAVGGQVLAPLCGVIESLQPGKATEDKRQDKHREYSPKGLWYFRRLRRFAATRRRQVWSPPILRNQL